MDNIAALASQGGSHKLLTMLIAGVSLSSQLNQTFSKGRERLFMLIEFVVWDVSWASCSYINCFLACQSGRSPFANAYRPSMPILPRPYELLDWYDATVVYGTLQQGGRASCDFYNILINEIVHVTENEPLEDVVTSEIIVWEKSCTVFI
ncbi:hypothetical protein GIB67_034860 [Kingdonia uniflora]|uniref:Uncharacterized protein n=1 Tax=Kingdonia uniflora TaxID=39325 RepID=A0A7J7MEH0_9MAGN|nr:hypothetical protein GIB67_034860 [Kingdonia uniflora]